KAARPGGRLAAATFAERSAPPVRPPRQPSCSSMTSSRRALRSTPTRPPSAPPGRRGSSSSPSRERPADRRLQVGRDLFDPFLDRPGDIHVRDAASGEVVDLLPLESARQLSLELTGPVRDPAELAAT